MDKYFIYDFHNNYSANASEYLGAQYTKRSTTFRVYAPNASSVRVIGDFNNWDEEKHHMTKVTDGGIFEIVIKGVKEFDSYKYVIYNKYNSKKVYKQDPYAYHNETDGKTNSKVYDIYKYKWHDKSWKANLERKDIYKMPINIYEVNLGSWRKYKDGNPYNYRDIALELIPYVKEMGYNFIEIMPITEYPFIGSWGYQVTGYYSVTSRYGVPDDFQFFVDYAHQNNIGVILDWVPAHFPKDEFGLYEFDGSIVYENPSPTRMEYPTWGTRIFNYQKPEVKSFLISSAKFLVYMYHLDGLRVDAVAAMLYLDYDRTEWQPNIYGSNYDLEAIDFLRTLNTEMFKFRRSFLMIAEESTAFPNVTKPVYLGGLGFNFKWNMGWMNDTLDYIKTDPLYKRYNHNKMTFPMTYIFSENYILPLSHDEVVHMKGSLINKMPGEYDDKFANLRTYYMYMMTHPGKKLLFMGGEFAQFSEWDEKKELDWQVLTYPRHSEMKEYVKDLNNLYLSSKSLYYNDDSWDGFEWIYADDSNLNTFVYIRKCYRAYDYYVVLNFSGRDLMDYEIHHHSLKGTYEVILNTDEYKYGGNNKFTYELKASKKTIKLNIPKFSGIIFRKSR